MTSSLGLRGQTAASLQAFKQRNENARRRVQALSGQPTTVDFARYRGLLKNRAVVDEIERRFRDFKPAAYDVQRQLKAIDAFEVEAVRNAQAAKQKVDLELKDLEATLTNIETARPFDELTVVCSRLGLGLGLGLGSGSGSRLRWRSSGGGSKKRRKTAVVAYCYYHSGHSHAHTAGTGACSSSSGGDGGGSEMRLFVNYWKYRKADSEYRTMLPPLSRASTRRRRSWCRRVAGKSQDTRYDIYTYIIFSSSHPPCPPMATAFYGLLTGPL